MKNEKFLFLNYLISNFKRKNSYKKYLKEEMTLTCS